MVPAGAGEAQRPEERAHDNGGGVFVPPRSPTVQAGHLLGQTALHLLLGHHLLDLVQRRLGLGELEAQRVDICRPTRSSWATSCTAARPPSSGSTMTCTRTFIAHAP
jgi:hypothetical protein